VQVPEVAFEESKGKMIIHEDSMESKKRGREVEDIVDDDYKDDEDDVEQTQQFSAPKLVREKKNPEGVKFGTEYKARKGTGGDMKRMGKPEPYAYIPLNPRQMNRRERNKDSSFGSFEKDAKSRRGKK
jgi:ribosomal RNA-processing protein 12